VKLDLTKTASENCPSFDICGTNSCPLHENYNKTLLDGKAVKGWRKCRCSRIVRMRIAEAFKLENKGLSGRELHRLNLKEEFSKANETTQN
jgi:hypothetical protein